MKTNTNIQKLTNQVHNLWSMINGSERAYGFGSDNTRGPKQLNWETGKV